jgi:hypothetical protein
MKSREHLTMFAAFCACEIVNVSFANPTQRATPKARNAKAEHSGRELVAPFLSCCSPLSKCFLLYGKTSFASIGYHLSQSPLIEAQGALMVNYTVLRNTWLRNFARHFGALDRVVRFYSSAICRLRFEGARTKSPCITMGFCVLGGHISSFGVWSQRAVMLCD